jgi:shikimate kinase
LSASEASLAETVCRNSLAEKPPPSYLSHMANISTPEPGSIILIGMPGVGKSTVGPLLARRTGRLFLDCDALLEQQEGRGVQEIVDSGGPLALRVSEERVLLGLTARRHVIATGGSAVYSDRAMRHLRLLGPVVWLRLGLDELARRIDNFAARGLAKRPEQTLADLYAERQPLYQRYADSMVDCQGLTPEAVVEKIIQALS